MARNTDLTQEKINEVADGLHSKGIKPSPNNVREVLGSGSFSTIKQMLDVWKEKQKEDESVFVPETPEFAYQHVDKLHKELYLHNRKLLDSERQQLQLTRQELEAEKSEMMAEINKLEDSIIVLKEDVDKKDVELNLTKTDLENTQYKLDDLTGQFNGQKVEIATLTEREKQQALHLNEKEVMLNERDLTIKQAELIRQELESEKSKMKIEINNLEESIAGIKREADKKDVELKRTKTDLEKTQSKLDDLTGQFNAQKVEIATLTEREKQQALHLNEKEAMLNERELALKQAQKIELALNKQIEELMKKLPK